ncbi:hypothetical protein, partial [Nocardia sp. NPDC046763]|uniref:hypothetical protein n=1 Tax=Nocardia sp. NPDC046763 TaxID=3155256 RepID=UPI0033CA58AD
MGNNVSDRFGTARWFHPQARRQQTATGDSPTRDPQSGRLGKLGQLAHRLGQLGRRAATDDT